MPVDRCRPHTYSPVRAFLFRSLLSLGLPLVCFAQADSPPTSAPAEAATAASPAAAATADAADSATTPAVASGQPQAPGVEQELFFETLDVNVINVDVYVTDKQGKPVVGLTRDDFELTENKKPMRISNFYAVEGGAAKNEEGQIEVEPSPIPGRPPVQVVPEDQRLRLVVYVDNFNIRPFNRNRVFRQIREFISKAVGTEDRVMLITYDRELHLRQPFTSDASLVTAALFDIEKMSGMGVQADSERRDILRAIEEAEDEYRISGRVRQYAQSMQNDMEFTVGAIKETVSSLAGLPGRKALLYVSDGIEMRPAEDIFIRVQDKFPDARTSLDVFSYDMSRRFNELAASANANRVSFYTLDAAGLRISSTLSAENQSVTTSAIGDSTWFSNLQAPLRYLADSTGGQSIVNTNNPAKGLDKIAQDFDNYYSLGYTPGHSGDGRYYKVDVKVKGRRDLVVRHRDGYRDKSVDVKMSDGTIATLHFGYEDNPLGITTELERIELRSDRNFNVTLAVKIPIGKLTLIPQPETHEARMRLFVSALDTEGRQSEVSQVPLTIRVPNAEVEQAKQRHWSYSVTLVMRGGPQKVAIAARDELAGTASFTSKHLTVMKR